MNHADHLALLRKGIHSPGGSWAELGSGTGAFTLALAELIGPEGVIYSVDKDRRALKEQERVMTGKYPSGKPVVHFIHGDFNRPLGLKDLDGVVMANSLHFIRSQEPLLASIRGMLRPGGALLLVEYNVDQGNPWVPYPISYLSWEKLAHRCGFTNIRLLEAVPSRFLREIYSATCQAGTLDSLIRKPELH